MLAVALALALFGYSVSAPFIQLVDPTGSRAAIVLRGFVVVICVACLLVYPRNKHNLHSYLWPVSIFLILYAARLYENFYVRNLEWQADPFTTFAFLFGGIFIPCFCLSKIIQNLDEGDYFNVKFILIVAFLIGLYLNLDYLLLTSKYSRASLEKLNPISIGAAASSFALLLLIARTKGFWVTLCKFAGVSILVGITAFVEARGPVVASVLASIIFLLVSKGAYRARFIYIGIIIGFILTLIAYYYELDFVEFAIRRFFTESEYYRGSGIGVSVDGRIIAYKLSWQQFLDNTIIGDKVFEPYLLQYPHNLFLESLISVGLLGSVFLLVHLYFCFRFCFMFFRSNRSTLIELFVSILFLKEFVAVQFSGAVWSNLVFWISSVCLVALGASRMGNRSGRSEFRRAEDAMPGQESGRSGLVHSFERR